MLGVILILILLNPFGYTNDKNKYITSCDITKIKDIKGYFVQFKIIHGKKRLVSIRSLHFELEKSKKLSEFRFQADSKIKRFIAGSDLKTTLIV